MIRSVKGWRMRDDAYRLRHRVRCGRAAPIEEYLETKSPKPIHRWTNERNEWIEEAVRSTLGLMPCVRSAEKSRLFWPKRCVYRRIGADLVTKERQNLTVY